MERSYEGTSLSKSKDIALEEARKNARRARLLSMPENTHSRTAARKKMISEDFGISRSMPEFGRWDFLTAHSSAHLKRKESRLIERSSLNLPSFILKHLNEL